jgi:N-acetylmuramoyl-L-alanine amidase
MFRRGKILVILVLLILGSGRPSCALAAHQILNLRHWVAPDHTRIVIDLSGDVTFTVDKTEKTVAVNLEDTAISSQIPLKRILNKPGLEGILLSSRPHSGVRVELLLSGPVETTVFKLKTFEDKPWRIVVDIVRPDAEKQESASRKQVKVTEHRARVIVIDPGHGGDDPGAVGKGKSLEKDVVLSIARKLRTMLNGKEGYRAFLTRDRDYYVSFKKRLMIAREYGADLFVSIHADAARSRRADGSSVYCLSTGAASNEAAKILARSENLADVVGGVPNGEGNDASDPIILDMFQTHTINQSKAFGAILLGELDAISSPKFENVQEAPFRVLKLPEIPSVLVETAYISNAKEEKLLRSSRFQTRIAETLAHSIMKFLPPLPPEEATSSVIKIEDRKHGEAFRKKEKAPSKRIEADKQGRGTEANRVYRVKKGDTITAIALRHGTTVRDLMELNHLKRQDSLYIGRKLILPAKVRFR